MKRIVAFLLTLMIMMTICACSSGETESKNTTPQESISDVSETPPMESSEPDVAETPTLESSEPDVAETPTLESSEQFASYEVTDCHAKIWTNSIGSVWLQTIVEITNTGTTNLYLSSGSYDLEDASGNLVASKTMVSAYPNVLAPGEKGYMYDETTLDEAVDGELTVLPREDVEEATVDLIRFPVTEIKLSDNTYGRVKMMGRVENTSGEDQNMVYIVAFLYDDSGFCIGQIFTILTEDLAAGDKIGFEMSGFSLPDDITAESVADYVIYAYPMQYQF